MDKYCSNCGGPLENKIPAGEEKTRQVCRDCHTIFYNNAKPCAAVLAVQDGRVLLVKRAIEPFKDFWDIPGGFLEADEHPRDGAIREFQEETGLLIEPQEILEFFIDEYGPGGRFTLNVCYVARVVGGQEKVGSDAVDLQWFDLDHLPGKIAFNWSNDALRLLRRKLNSKIA